jgi:hypothetical protein
MSAAPANVDFGVVIFVWAHSSSTKAAVVPGMTALSNYRRNCTPTCFESPSLGIVSVM